jgi:hypothetical protein
MKTCTASIVDVPASTAVADVATKAHGNTFVVTRNAAGDYFALKPREAERLGEELPGETFEAALAKARWTPSRTHREVEPTIVGATAMISMMPLVVLQDDRDRVVVIGRDGRPTAVVHHERSPLDDRKWIIDNCPATQKLYSSFLPITGAVVRVVDMGKAYTIDSDEIGTALDEARKQWRTARDPKMLHAALLKLLALAADAMK